MGGPAGGAGHREDGLAGAADHAGHILEQGEREVDVGCGQGALDGLGIEVSDEELTFRLVQLCGAATGKPLTDDELRLIAGYREQLALLYPGQV